MVKIKRIISFHSETTEENIHFKSILNISLSNLMDTWNITPSDCIWKHNTGTL